MSRSYTVYQINSFTTKKFTGNPAGVVVNAEGLSDPEMLLIARELKNSETAFIFSPGEKHSGYDVEVRFFTPTTEVPICGHATIAAHFVRALERQAHPGQTVLQKTKAGILPIEILDSDGNLKIKMTQGNIAFEPVSELNKSNLLKALGIDESELSKDCPIEIASTGHSKVMIGINSREKLNRLSPDLGELKKISAAIRCNGYFVFTFDSDSPEILTHGRMFAPAIGIDEDPVTGNANGPLGAYIVKNRLTNFDGDRFSFVAKQGEAMGRPGTMEVFVDVQNRLPLKVEILGEAVPVFKTIIELA
ncbi:MAG TPA: PhzF family isomerase [Chryseolinea sp.]